MQVKPSTASAILLLSDEVEPRILAAEKASRVVWSSLWPSRPSDQVHFELTVVGNETSLKFTLLTPDEAPDQSKTGHLRRRLNHLLLPTFGSLTASDRTPPVPGSATRRVLAPRPSLTGVTPIPVRVSGGEGHPRVTWSGAEHSADAERKAPWIVGVHIRRRRLGKASIRCSGYGAFPRARRSSRAGFRYGRPAPT